MLGIGLFHRLKVLEMGVYGATLDGGNSERLLLPSSQCNETLLPGDDVEVFVYLDADGEPVPTTRRPAATLGQVAWLAVVAVNSLGAFVDWGLPKDLFIPFAEQQRELRKGDHDLVWIYQDNQGRLAGSTRIDHWIQDDSRGLRQGEKVSLLIGDRTDLGFKAIINHRSWGLLYANEVYQTLRKGQVIEGYIKHIRDDGKIDLSLDKPGFSKNKIASVTAAILTALRRNNGFLALTDKSPPTEIHAAFGVSKKVFKQAIGVLYKQRRIALESTGIRLIE